MLQVWTQFLALLSGVQTANWPVMGWDDLRLAGDAKPIRYIAASDFTPSRHNVRLSGHRGVSGHLFAVTIVGCSADEVRATRDAIQMQLDGQKLAAGTGEAMTTPLFQDETENPLRPLEDTTNPRLFHAVDLWRCATS